jgi:hypothetical protein
MPVVAVIVAWISSDSSMVSIVSTVTIVAMRARSPKAGRRIGSSGVAGVFTALV